MRRLGQITDQPRSRPHSTFAISKVLRDQILAFHRLVSTLSNHALVFEGLSDTQVRCGPCHILCSRSVQLARRRFRLSDLGHVNAIRSQHSLIIDFFDQSFLHHSHVLHQVTFNFDIREVKASLAANRTTSDTTRREAAMANYIVRALLLTILSHLNRLLAQLVITLDAADRQWIKVDVAEFRPRADLLICIALIYILGIPLLTYMFIGCHIV